MDKKLMNAKFFLTLNGLAILGLSACSVIPKEGYETRGQPEALLEVASEEITVDLSQRNGIMQLSDVVVNRNPSSAELVCSNTMLCNQAADVLRSRNVQYTQTRGMGNSAILSFDDIIAHDCQNRFITNHNNPYNLNHPTFGCSVAVNQVQMVSDKRQYVDPLLLGPYDGQKAAQNYDTYISREPVELEQQSASEAAQ